MIEPTDADAGRQVLYRPWPGAPAERGVLRAWSAEYCFVVYGREQHAKATRREDLEWAEGTAEAEAAEDECGDCGGKVSAEDEACPHCGAA